MSQTRNGFSRVAVVLLVLAGLLMGAQPNTAAAQGLNVTMMPMPEVLADGQPRGVNFVVTQANGMLAADAAIGWSHVDKGALGACQAAGAGILACTYTPPADGAAGQAVLMIDVTSGGQKVSQHFTITLGAAAVAPAPVAPAPVAPAPVAPAPATTQPWTAPAPVAPAPVAPAPVAPAPVAPAPVAPATATVPPPVTVAPAPVPVAPVAPVTSYLTVSAKPWATVYLDGVIVGNTPIKQAPVDPGTHMLVLRCGPCAEPQERRYSFTVAGGDTYTNVTTDFTAIPATVTAPTTPAPAPALTAPVTTTTTTTATTTGATDVTQFPFTDQPYRLGRVFVRYPVMGYRYNQAAGVCAGDRPCPHFVDLNVAGPNGDGLVAAPAAIGVYGEIFPIEFAGLAVSYETFKFATDHTVVHEDGSEGTFGDAINRIFVGARFRLPLLNNRAQGPLDIIADVGYMGQDFLYFETTEVENAWTFSNLWANGVRFGFGARFQAIPEVQIHGDWHGTAVGSGLVSHEAEVGVQLRVYKMISIDLSWLLVSRSVTVAKQYAQEETAAVGDFGTGAGLAVGAVF